MDKVNIDGVECDGVHIATGKSNLLLLRARNGMVGCGYFDIATANRLGEAFVIVRGVKNYDDMLNASAAQVSEAAGAMGIQVGMKGREVMARLNG